MIGNNDRDKDFSKGLLSRISFKHTLLISDPHDKDVTRSARRSRQKQPLRQSHAQRSSTLEHVYPH